jgi:hypothetical protein
MLTDRFILSFAGTLSESQDLTPVIKAVNDLRIDNAEIRLVGAVNQVFYEKVKKNWLETMIVIADYMPHGRLMKYLSNSHSLLHPMPKMSYPANGAKVYDYLSLHKNILVLEHQDNQVLTEMIENTGRGKICRYEDEKAIREYIAGVYELFSVEIG